MVALVGFLWDRNPSRLIGRIDIKSDKMGNYILTY